MFIITCYTRERTNLGHLYFGEQTFKCFSLFCLLVIRCSIWKSPTWLVCALLQIFTIKLRRFLTSLLLLALTTVIEIVLIGQNHAVYCCRIYAAVGKLCLLAHVQTLLEVVVQQCTWADSVVAADNLLTFISSLDLCKRKKRGILAKPTSYIW